VSHFDDLTRVVMVVKVKSKALFIGPYSNSQQRLFERAFLLRERDELTFEAIAKLLTKSGTRSVNGWLLGAENVFSIWRIQDAVRGVSRLVKPYCSSYLSPSYSKKTHF
jgi:hypothetical protein